MAFLDVSDADIHETADGIGVGRDAERDRGFVGCGSPADVDDQPRVRDLDVSWRTAAIATAQDATSEHRFVKPKRSLDIRDRQEVRDGEPHLRGHLIAALFDVHLAHGLLLARSRATQNCSFSSVHSCSTWKPPWRTSRSSRDLSYLYDDSVQMLSPRANTTTVPQTRASCAVVLTRCIST